jgi:thiol:disulfide interchange protein
VHETLLVFLFLGLGMAFPIWLLTRKPNWLQWLPKPGPWMGAVKQWLAFPLLATVAWLLWVFVLQTNPDALLKALMALVVLACFFWLLGSQQMRKSSFAKANLLSRLVLVILLGWLSFGALNQSDEAHPSSAASGVIPLNQTTWQPFAPALLQESLKQQRAIMIDFTAAWCVSCQVNKQAVLETTAAKDLFAKHNVLLLKADWTKRDPVISQALAGYGRNAVPLYVIYKAGSSQPIILPEILTMTYLRDSFER